MIDLPGYNIRETVYESKESLVVRAVRQRDSAAVLLKTNRTRHPSPAQLARLRREFEIAQDIRHDHVVAYHALEPWRNGLVLILEDFHGRSLAQVLRERTLDLGEFLRVAMALTDGLGAVHAARVVHKDIKPDNVILHEESGTAKIVDFGIASRISRETPSAATPGKLEGTLAYMSPEQTGRMNRPVDYRADFYSLGATFYQMLSGKTPFAGAGDDSDPMSMVHNHIAREPAPPVLAARNNAPVPSPLRAILSKLMAKNAEDRYRSAFGLRADLEACLRAVESAGGANTADGGLAALEQFGASFQAGTRDFSEVFQIPQKLYGRDKETTALLESFDRSARGDVMMLLVAGRSGVGKSALINEIHKPIAKLGGYFISGKFDQFKRDVPYSALIQAFQEIVQKILTESAEQIEEWRERLVEAFGRNGQVIIEVIPEVGHIVGEQAAVPELPPTESRNRFVNTFQSFMRAFAREDHPLAVFLDDLQWADSATLNLLKLLMTDPDAGHLFLIGAYRDNEVNDAHPLMLALEDMRLNKATIQDLKLVPLGLNDVAAITADTLRLENAEDCDDLTRLIFKKTDGNPFFVNEFLKSLAEEDLVRLDRSNGQWNYDLYEIQARGLSDDILELLLAKLRKLDAGSRDVLKIAAALGARFDLRMLSLAFERSYFETAQLLERPLKEGFLVPRDDAYKYVAEGTDAEAAAAVGYAFLHDRVQQAAYALLDDDEKEELHLRIGRLYVANVSYEERDEKLVDIVNHWNLGRNLIRDEDERVQLAEFNLGAGRKAKDATAYEGALRLFHIGLELLPADAATRFYDVFLALNRELGETYYVVNDLRRAEKFFDVVLDRAKRPLEKLRIYEIKIDVATGRNEPEEAVRIGIEALDTLGTLGMKLSANPSAATARSELSRVSAQFKRKAPQSLLSLPRLDPDAQELQNATLRILMQLGMPAYVLSSNLFPVLIARMILISLKYGNAKPSAYAYAAYGMLCAGMLDDPDRGYEFGRVAVDLLEELGAQELKCRVLYLFASSMHHWRHHVSQKEAVLLEAYQSGLETGDLPYVALCIYTINATPLWAGTKKLSSVDRSMEKYYNALYKTGQSNMLALNDLNWQYIRNMQGGSRNKARLSGDRFREQDVVPEWERTGNANALYYVNLSRTVLSTLFGNHEQARDFAAQAAKYESAVTGSYAPLVLRFYLALSLTHLFGEELQRAKGGRRKSLPQEIEDLRFTLGTYAERCPENFQHMFELLEAELARVHQDHGRAMDFYDRAVASARANEYVLHEGLANELAAAYYLDLAKTRFAAIYLGEARRAYVRCRATAKASEIELSHEELIRSRFAASSAGATPTVQATGVPDETSADIAPDDPDDTTTSMTITQESGGSALDMQSVIKASQTIAGEIQLAELLQKLMRIVMENAGAQRGVLLLTRGGGKKNQAPGLNIEAEMHVQSGEPKVLQALPLEDIQPAEDLPRSLVQYVERTRESVVLFDASREDGAGNFAADPYIREIRPRSVLGAPIILQGKLIGVLYLENAGTPGAFTNERIEVLNMLSSQIASSIENARLYQAQIELNRASSLFVPTEFLRLLGVESIVNVKLGDNILKEMTVLFSDIRSFTSLSESMTPEENFEFINTYLSFVGPVVREHNGFIDKYIGDAIMALFPTPEDGLRAAASMHQALARYNNERRSRGQDDVRTGIGVNTGTLMLGTIGEANRMEGTVIADAVNLAARMEGLTKIYGASLIVSGHTFAKAANREDFEYRILDRVQVKGKTDPVDIIEILDAEPADTRRLKLETRSTFEEASRVYRGRDFVEAAKLFQDIHEKNPDDLAVRLYRRRCKIYHEKGVPDDWNGVEVLSVK